MDGGETVERAGQRSEQCVWNECKATGRRKNMKAQRHIGKCENEARE